VAVNGMSDDKIQISLTSRYVGISSVGHVAETTYVHNH
jgi:hypothetical protein